MTAGRRRKTRSLRMIQAWCATLAMLCMMPVVGCSEDEPEEDRDFYLCSAEFFNYCEIDECRDPVMVVSGPFDHADECYDILWAQDDVGSENAIVSSFTIDPAEAQDRTSDYGVGVAFDAGSLEPEGGGELTSTATLRLATFLQEEEVNPADFPGSFIGIDANGQEVALVSYGVIGVTVRDANGALLNLKSGAEATITLPALPGGPAEAPLWYKKDASEIWREEGTATLEGDVYVGTITHFSLWNVDIACSNACINVSAVDEQGNPLGGIQISASVHETTCEFWSEDALSGGFCTTGADGTCTIDGLPADSTLVVWGVHNSMLEQVTVIIPESGDACIDAETLVFGPQRHLLTCDIGVATGMCIEYEFDSQSDRDSFSDQCAYQKSNSHDCPSGGVGCRHTSSGRVSDTYVYGMDEATVDSECRATSGTPI